MNRTSILVFCLVAFASTAFGALKTQASFSASAPKTPGMQETVDAAGNAVAKSTQGLQKAGSKALPGVGVGVGTGAGLPAGARRAMPQGAVPAGAMRGAANPKQQQHQQQYQQQQQRAGVPGRQNSYGGNRGGYNQQQQQQQQQQQEPAGLTAYKIQDPITKEYVITADKKMVDAIREQYSLIDEIQKRAAQELEQVLEAISNIAQYIKRNEPSLQGADNNIPGSANPSYNANQNQGYEQGQSNYGQGQAYGNQGYANGARRSSNPGYANSQREYGNGNDGYDDTYVDEYGNQI